MMGERIARFGRVALLVAVVAAVVGGGFAGAAAATTTTTAEPEPTEVTLPHEDTIEISNDTAEIYVQIRNASDQLNVTVSGIADGNQTDLGTLEFEAGANTTKTVAINASEFDAASVAASSDATGATVEIAAGTVSESELGGGFLGGDGGGTSAAVLLALAAGGALLMRED